MGYVDGPDDRERAFAAELEVKHLQAELARQLQATRDVDDLRMGEIRDLNARQTELRRRVQQARKDYYEQAIDHGELSGHEEQEARAYGRVEMCDEVLGWLTGDERKTQLAADLGTHADLPDPIHHHDPFSRIEASTHD